MREEKFYEVLKPTPRGKTLYFTLGNPFRGDDGVGFYIYKNIRGTNKNAVVIYIKDNWEKMIEYAQKFKPQKIVIIDGANFSENYGEIAMLDIENINNAIVSTHTFPLELIYHMIKKDVGCEIKLIGIQVKSLSFDGEISPEVKDSAMKIIKLINEFDVSKLE